MKELDDKDDFWSLDSMLPPSAFEKKYIKTKNDVSSVEIELEGNDTPHGEEIPKRAEQKYPPITASASGGERIDFDSWLKEREKYRNGQKKVTKRVVAEYSPHNPFINKVTVSEELGARALTERFLKDGYELFSAECAFTGNVELNSVYPQYASLSKEQRECYIGFRSEVRKGCFPKVDRAYIYLYLYELINLTEAMTPAERAESMARLLCGYPECDDKLFSDMCNWLSDICLIYGLDIPECIYGDVHPRVLKLARIKEVYAKINGESSESSMYRLMLSAGRYDYRTSRFYPEFKEYYDKYIDNAVCYALSEISKTDPRFVPNENDLCTITHDSFFGAYRTSGARRTVSLECICLTRSDEEKRVVSELIKYAENTLRSLLSIKQRLTVNYISLEKKSLIKRYFAENAVISPTVKRAEKRGEKPPELPEYEKLYEPKPEKFTFENASEIEERSWDVTEKLVSAFEGGEENEEGAVSEIKENECPIAPATDENAEITLTGEHSSAVSGLRFIASNDTEGFKRLAEENGMLAEAFVDMINEFLLNEIGDVGVESDVNGYKIAEWYTDDINELLKKYRKV